MRRSRAVILLLVPVLALAIAVPYASARAEHTDFYGLYFPAGLPGTGSVCPYTWMDPSFCIIDQGSWSQTPSGRIAIRGMTLYELAYSWHDPAMPGLPDEPRKTGYDIVLASANLDATLSGPTWGTWNLYSFSGELMFTGTFTGMFKNGVPAVHYVGLGTGNYEGQHMRGNISRVPSPYNMVGVILEPGSP